MVGTTASPPRWSTSLLGSTLLEPNLKQTRTHTHTHVSLKPHHHCLYTDSDYICILTAKINVFILRKDHDSHCLKRHFKYFLGVALQIDDGMMCSDSAVLNSPRRSFCLWLWRSDVCL